MALTPYLLRDVLGEFARPLPLRLGSLYDQNFGLGVLNDDLIHPIVPSSLLAGYIRPWRHLSSRDSGMSNVQNTPDGFKVNLDVQQFKPDEINVKMVDNCIVVEGKHEERQDEHGYISRHFQRRYRLPDDVDSDAVISKLSSDGVLIIEAPKKAIAPPSKERVIQITHTNAPAVTPAPQTQEKKESDGKTSEK